MSHLYFIQYSNGLSKPVSFYGDTNFGRATIACYTTQQGAINTLNRIRKHMEVHNIPPSFDVLCTISPKAKKNIKDNLSICYRYYEGTKKGCELHGLSLSICKDTDGLCYEEQIYNDMGHEAYKETLNYLLTK